MGRPHIKNNDKWGLSQHLLGLAFLVLVLSAPLTCTSMFLHLLYKGVGPQESVCTDYSWDDLSRALPRLGHGPNSSTTWL